MATLVINRTFFELQSSETTGNRFRSVSDSCEYHEYKEICCNCESVECACCEYSTDAGDLTPRAPSEDSDCNKWGCDDLEIHMAADVSHGTTPSHTPMTPPGVFGASPSVPSILSSACQMSPTCWVSVSCCPSPQAQLLPSPMQKTAADVPLLMQFQQQQTAVAQTFVASTQESRSTLMLKNLPSCFSRDKLCKILEDAGFAGRFDFVYIPVDFASGAGLGYAFINMVSSEDALMAMVRLTGFNNWQETACHKVLDVCWSDPLQGLDMLIDRYRNSRVMHKSVPDKFKPILLEGRNRIPFAPPTKRVRSPM